MKLIAGLGNPGPRYAASRHNIGYMLVDEVARRWGASVTRYDRHFEGLWEQVTAAGHAVLLLKPLTFMNLSGRSVAAVWRYYKLETVDVLTVHDDLDLPVGQLRLRATGSAGGHKGMEDVIRHLGTFDLPRLRLGIGKVHRDATVEFVLSQFEPGERPAIEAALGRAVDAVECWLRDGIDAAMNRFNRKQDADAAAPRHPQAPASEGESS